MAVVPLESAECTEGATGSERRAGRSRPGAAAGRCAAVGGLVLAVVGSGVLGSGALAASTSAATMHRVQRGDTLSAIARQHGTTLSALLALNHVRDSGNLIFPGQVIRLPGGGVRSAPAHRQPAKPVARPAARPRPATVASRVYVVQRGDWQALIAHRFGVTLAWLRAVNHLPANRSIQPGQRLVVSTVRPAPAARPRPAAPTAAKPRSVFDHTYPATVQARAARDRARIQRMPHPSRTAVRSLVVRAAQRNRLDPMLALAVAYQESGFQQNVVSPADAIGTMQVLPSTGEYIGRNLVHRRVDLFKAEDNVTAGVSFLASLVRAAGTPTGVGAYYQGLGSIRRHGMAADTKVYVRSVLAHQARFRAGG